VRTLVVLGTIVAFVSVLAIWVNLLALDTDTWVDTSDALIADDAVRAALAATSTDSLYSSGRHREQLGLLPCRFDRGLPSSGSHQACHRLGAAEAQAAGAGGPAVLFGASSPLSTRLNASNPSATSAPSRSTPSQFRRAGTGPQRTRRR
jgi:hypothetical protein